MTVLAKYARLEARGLWRDLPEAQRREVVVNLGDATLVMTDPRSDVPITHWSLPAVQRMNPGETPALFVPGPDSAESLELSDAEMIAALETVHRAIASARPREGRLRGLMLGGALAGVLAAGVFWLPDALVAHTASVLPPATRDAIGRMALADLSRVAGAPCQARAGRDALIRMAVRLFPSDDAPALSVVREGFEGALHLPGRHVVLSQALLVEADGPEVVAGRVIAERLRSAAADPVVPLLRHAGLIATLRLLTTGALPPGSANGYAEVRLAAEPAPLDPEAALAAFRRAEVATAPYAYATDPSGETVLAL
ncbi:MAG TPA: hypothetical protein PKD10_08800, partial [Paracoccaceae bacterium]|nr:hypothetical protein [Paracoccaceae bacterium]